MRLIKTQNAGNVETQFVNKQVQNYTNKKEKAVIISLLALAKTDVLNTAYVRACVNCFWSDTSVDLDVEIWCHLTNSPNFAHHVGHEGLATVPGFHCHNQDHVGITYIFLNNFNAGVGFHSNASLK